MERKEDTPVRKTRRKYEEKNKEKRKQASGNFGTMIPRALYDEINAFLEENGITKVRLIKEGYGGAYKCYKYAQELGVPIMNIADNIKNQEW